MKLEDFKPLLEFIAQQQTANIQSYVIAVVDSEGNPRVHFTSNLMHMALMNKAIDSLATSMLHQGMNRPAQPSPENPTAA